MRTLHLTNPLERGADVTSLQHALVARGYKVDIDGVFGPHTAAAVKRAKWDIGYPEDELLPVAGERFHRYLLTNGVPADYKVRRVERAHSHKLDDARQHVRDEIVKWARWGCEHERDIHYEQVRPYPLEADLPLYTDCSGFVSLCYKLGGAYDPNGSHYDGRGYTGTLLEHGRPVTLAQAKPADLVIFGAYPGHHVAVIVENDGHDPILVSHGQELGPLEIALSDEALYQAPVVAFRTYL